MRYLTFLILLIFANPNLVQAARVKDVARVQGSRQNQLVGYGVVIGLAGTGDSNPNVTLQTVGNLLNRFGVTVTTTDIKANNVAIVVVTADVPPFLRTGSRIDVNVASMADSKSLVGGVLLQTPLIGADGQVYAVAQGALAIGGFFAGGSGAGSASLQKNHPTVGQIANGALIEREIPTELVSVANTIDISLNEPDFTSAAHMADALNKAFLSAAMAVDSGTVRIQIPVDYMDPSKHVQFISLVEGIETEPDTTTKVVINERTGTIVANSRIRISSVAVAHGNFKISIANSQTVSQPTAASSGTTLAVPSQTTKIEDDKAKLVLMQDLPTVETVAGALNALGATPRDLMTIFQTLKQAGALQAELVVR